MPLATTLNTNEIKGSTGTGVSFSRFSSGPGRAVTYALTSETPNKPNRMTISHQEVGSGITRRRRSVVSFERSDSGQVDATQIQRNRAYAVLDFQVGNATDTVVVKELLAYLMSFMASLGASTTILYDGTGNGAATLLAGSL